MCKSYLHHATGGYPKTGPNAHSLKHLAGLVAQAGGPSIPDRFLDQVDCKPGMRYGDENPGTAAHAVDTLRLALGFGGMLAALVRHKHPVPGRHLGDGQPGDANDVPRELLSLLWERAGIPESDPDGSDGNGGAS
jgi:hypothetical protein